MTSEKSSWTSLTCLLVVDVVVVVVVFFFNAPFFFLRLINGAKSEAAWPKGLIDTIVSPAFQTSRPGFG